jgi:hypothetical protein
MPIKSLLFIMLVPMILAGCGGGTSSNSTSVASKLAASQGCINCHGTRLSPGSGAVIAQEWLASTHATQNAAGCADCHEPDSGHPNLCNKCHAGGGYGVTKNPDEAGKCGKCHGLAHPQDIMMTLTPKHFGNMTASTNNSNYRASYMSSNYAGNCRKCHNPHDPTSAHQMNADWAASGHGNVTKARTNYDFKTRGTYEPVNLTFQYYCVRCHTTTGYVNYVTSGFTNQSPFAGPGFAVVQNAPVLVAPGVAQPADAPSPDKTKEVTGCDACHDDGAGRAYGFGVRAVPAVRAYYNFSSSNSSPTVRLNDKPVYYPDAGASNTCITCHAGRGIGSMVYDAAALGMDFSSTNSPGAHDRAAATTIFQTGGYEFAGRNYTNPSFTHNKTGMANFQGTGTSGPCVTCHMRSDSTHSFDPVTTDAAGKVTAIISRACASCHDATLTSVSLETSKEGFAAAFAMLNVLKTDPTLPSDPLNPSRSKVRPLATKNSDYNAAFPGGGANTMGAFFNAGLLQNELGAFAHNSLYARRLIYDSIDWLSNGVMDNDVESAINNATLAVNSSTGKVSLANSIMGGSYISAQLPSHAYDVAFAKVKSDAIKWLLGGPGGGRP